MSDEQRQQADEQQQATAQLLLAIGATPNDLFHFLHILLAHGECVVCDTDGNSLVQVALAAGRDQQAEQQQND